VTSLGVFERENFGRLFAFVDLVNSETWNGFGRHAEHLDDAEWKRMFRRRWGLGPLPSRPRLIQLRRLLRRVATAIAEGVSPAGADLARLNRYLAAPARRRLRRQGAEYQLLLEPARPGPDGILAAIVASFADMLAHREPARLKFCPNHGCRWLFYDETRGNTRRWCDDRACGNRDKVRRLRERRRKQASGAG